MFSQRQFQIIETAARLIRHHGYDNTSMRDLAAALNMEASSLYNHIKSKEDILTHICFTMAKEFLILVDEVNDIYFDATKKLHLAVENHIQLLTQNPDKAYVFVHEWRRLNETDKAQFIILRDKYEQGFMQIIQTGENEGIFNEVDKKFAVLTILSSLNWVVEWYNPQGNKKPKEIAAKLTEFILQGLRKDRKF